MLGAYDMRMLLERQLPLTLSIILFFFSSRRRHTRFKCDWSSDVCSSDLTSGRKRPAGARVREGIRRGRLPPPPAPLRGFRREGKSWWALLRRSRRHGKYPGTAPGEKDPTAWRTAHPHPDAPIFPPVARRT